MRHRRNYVKKICARHAATAAGSGYLFIYFNGMVVDPVPALPQGGNQIQAVD
jgi:hypothetical protein